MNMEDMETNAAIDSLESEQAGQEDADVSEVPADHGIPQELRAPVLEALLISHGEPLDVSRISEVTALPSEQVLAALEELRARYELPSSGIELVMVGGKYQVRTKVQYGSYIRILKSEKPKRLSTPALETLAIVAYRQPVVKSDIEKIRGVDSTPTLKTLLERGLIRVVGQASSVGQPSLYGTTDEFLKIFGLKSLTEMPSLREATALERDPGEPEYREIEGDTMGTSEVQGVEAEALEAGPQDPKRPTLAESIEIVRDDSPENGELPMSVTDQESESDEATNTGVTEGS
jgi:segregation and condensation protein B